MLQVSINFLLLLLPLSDATLGTYQGEDCIVLDPNSPTRNGTCMEIADCDYAKKHVQRNEKPDLCGPQTRLNRKDRLACCPVLPSKQGDNCVIWGYIKTAFYGRQPNIAGKCKLLEECETAKSLLKLKKRIDTCFLNDKLVCCPLEKYPPILFSADEICADRYMVHAGFQKVDAYTGEFALPREFPHMVAIGYKEINSTSTWFCGGSVISEFFVLTAAHCTNFHGRSPNLVRIGDLDLNNPTEGRPPPLDIPISKIYRHPDYKFSSHYHDIALLRVESEISLFFFKPICLHNRKEDIPFQLEAIAWSQIENGSRSHLLKMSLNFTEHNVCASTFSNDSKTMLKNGIVDELQFCAGGMGYDTPCEGGSGGPLHYVLPGNVLTGEKHFVLVGIASFGKECGKPVVYTRVSAYIPWIDSIVWPPEITELTTENAQVQAKVDEKCIEHYKVKEGSNEDSANDDSTVPLPGDFPHLAAVGYRRKNNVIQWLCWGSIISEYFIISSARWTNYLYKDANIVQLGDLKLNGPKRGTPVIIGIRKIYRYPNYRPSAGYHDIALLKVEHGISLHIFKPICLHTRKEIPFELEAVGWGLENNTRLLKVSLNVIDHSVCNSKFQEGPHTAKLKKGVISKLQICASTDNLGYGEPTRKACSYFGGPSHFGGPLHYKVPNKMSTGRVHFVLVGITLFGENCGELGVYTRVSPYVSWIDSIVWPPKVTEKVTEDV